MTPRSNMWERLSLHKLGGWLKKDEADAPPPHGDRDSDDEKKLGFLNRRPSRKVVPGLPRPLTFKRQESERRERLVPYEPGHDERRAVSSDRVDRQSAGTSKRTLSPPPQFHLRSSAPDSLSRYAPETHESFMPQDHSPPKNNGRADDDNTGSMASRGPWDFPPPLSTTGPQSDNEGSSEGVDEVLIQQELDAKWILNLSMHFRDMSDREKFFVTYAELPTRWRRVTVSIDYRDAEPESLEADLKSLHYQRDKSARIYEAIRESLPDIQFYETVTNLKLETSEGRLHVHVTEDVNEIIPYPPTSAISHLDCPVFHESDVRFESHLSGFVYKISVKGQVYIKKEIPGPEAVEEFLYETNCLSRVRGAHSVIHFAGVITDDSEQRVTGLLINFAEKGALVDLLYDWKSSSELLWPRRERWAKQIVQGLSEIHESGFVQGDFTLSNIVIDADDDAKIIDINRRGCPVGWEPPELAKLIEAGQKISIYIGVKSDLFQLGMVLWALAEQQDEPERQERPLLWTPASDGIPAYYKAIADACLSDEPRDRFSAKDLLARFPAIDPEASKPPTTSRHSLCTHRSDKEYIDPRTAVGRDDIDRLKRARTSPERTNQMSSVNPSSANLTDVVPPTEYDAQSSGSYIMARRGRSSSDGRRTLEYSPFVRASSNVSLDDSELGNEITPLPGQQEMRWEQVYVDGDTHLVHRGGPLSIDERNFPAHEQATVCISTPKTEQTDPLQQFERTDPGPAPHSPDLVGIGGYDRNMPPPALPFLSGELLGQRASFHDRIQQRNSHDDVLAGLVQEVYENRDEEILPSRSRFSPPTHQDSGFHDYDIEADLAGLSSHHDHVPHRIEDFEFDLESHDNFGSDQLAGTGPTSFSENDGAPLDRRASANTVKEDYSFATTASTDVENIMASTNAALDLSTRQNYPPDITFDELVESRGEQNPGRNANNQSCNPIRGTQGISASEQNHQTSNGRTPSGSSGPDEAVWFPWMSQAENRDNVF